MLSARRRDSSSIPVSGLAATIDEIIATCRRRATRMHYGFYLPTRARPLRATACPRYTRHGNWTSGLTRGLARTRIFVLRRGRADLFAHRYTQDRISNREAFDGAITWPAIPSESEPHNLFLTARACRLASFAGHRYGTPNEATQCRRNAG